MRIDVNSLRMDGSTADSDGSIWSVTDLEGWEAIDPQVSTLSLTGRNGAALERSNYAERAVVVSGICQATSDTNRWKSRRKLAGLIGLTTPAALDVYEPGLTATLDVIQGGRLNVRPFGIAAFEWQLSLQALNPFKRGASHTETLAAGGSKTITYAGTAQGFPTATLTSGGTVDLANSTTSTRVQCSTLASGAVIDNYARTVYAGTTNRFSTVAPGVAWVTLLPGSNSVTNAGTAALTLTWFDLYL